MSEETKVEEPQGAAKPGAQEPAAAEAKASKKPSEPKLDRSKDFAAIRGQGIAARYLQSGSYFNGAGKYIGKKLA